MKTFNSQSGFTLMEIIVVMIILGVVAALGMGAIFGNIERSRSQEALSNISGPRQNIEGCAINSTAAGLDVTNCNIANIPVSSNFTYAVNSPIPAGTSPTGAAITAANGGIQIVATRAANAGGSPVPAACTAAAPCNIIMSRTAANTWVCRGTNLYLGVCS